MGAPDVLQHLHAAGLHLALIDGKIIVQPRSKLTDNLRQSIKDNRDKLLQALAATSRSGNPLMTAEQADDCHAGAWDDTELSAFTTRVLLLQRRGIEAGHAVFGCGEFRLGGRRCAPRDGARRGDRDRCERQRRRYDCDERSKQSRAERDPAGLLANVQGLVLLKVLPTRCIARDPAVTTSCGRPVASSSFVGAWIGSHGPRRALRASA